MARLGFCGPSYTSQSMNVDCQALINWYLERNENENSKSAFSLYPCAGTKLFTALIEPQTRGGVIINGRLFVAAGVSLYEVFADGTKINRGALVNDGALASFAASETQLFIISGGRGYSYDLAGNALVDQTAKMLGVPSVCGYLDGFFIVLLANSNQFQISGVLDATSWDALDTAKISVFPDNCVSMIVDHREIWFLGLTRSVGYYNTGDPDFPFSPIPGTLMETGSGAQLAARRADNSFFWWDLDERGSMIARRAEGYKPARISNFGIEFAVQGYSKTSDAVSYVFQDQGHTFWQTFFPSANNGKGVTWVYDAATGQWHQRSYLVNGEHTAHRSWWHVFAFGKHLVGDWATGKIYQMAIPVADGAGGWLFCDDAGNLIRRVRRTPILSLEGQRMFFDQLQIDLETGLGPIPALTNDGLALAADGSNARAPQLMLRWSDDSGKTWSNERVLDCGQAGQYKARVIARRLGSSVKGRVFEISCTDPIPWRIADAYIKGTGFETTQRISTKLGQGA